MCSKTLLDKKCIENNVEGIDEHLKGQSMLCFGDLEKINIGAFEKKSL